MANEMTTRSMQTVRDLLSNPERLEMAVKLMCESDRCDGMLARIGGQLQHFVDKEKSSTLTTLSRHLRFLDSSTIAASTRTSSFDPADFRKGKLTVYLILPVEHMRSEAGLLRMWISTFLKIIQSQGTQE
jgi:type IV secretion system protein VirD4